MNHTLKTNSLKQIKTIPQTQTNQTKTHNQTNKNNNNHTNTKTQQKNAQLTNIKWTKKTMAHIKENNHIYKKKNNNQKNSA